MGWDWNELINREISFRAKEWFLELEDLKEIKVPRSLRVHKVEKSSSVHTFVDASKDAYGAVAYCTWDVYDQGYYCAPIITTKTEDAL